MDEIHTLEVAVSDRLAEIASITGDPVTPGDYINDESAAWAAGQVLAARPLPCNGATVVALRRAISELDGHAAVAAV